MAKALSAGSEVGGYRIESVIGRGGMGVVFLAEQKRLGRKVALKVIAPERVRDANFRRRFERESQLAASIEHPNAVPVYEVGETPDGELFIAMRYVPGTDLKSVIRKEEWLDPARAAALVGQVAGALDEAHSRGLVHRDVKPANILIGETGGREWAYLTDFGLTKQVAAETQMTATGEWMGSLDYASPEQMQGQDADARSDVYSLGCVLYEALTGDIPFPREAPAAKITAHLNDPPPRASEMVPELDPSLDAVIARAMAKDPEERYPSAGDLGRATESAARGDGATVPERSVARGAAAGTEPHGGPAGPGGTERASAPEAAEVATAGAPASRSGETPTRITRERGRPSPRALLIGAAALLASAVVAVGASQLGGSDEPDGGGGGGTGGVPEVAGSFTLGRHPLMVATGEGSVWATNEAAGTLSRVDPSTGEPVTEPVRVVTAEGNRATGLALSDGFAFVGSRDENQVVRLDASDLSAEPLRIDVGSEPIGVVAAGGSIWSADSASGTVTRIDPRSGEVVGTISVGSDPRALGEGAGSVWVANFGSGDVTRIDATTGDVQATIPVGENPRGVTVGNGFAWVANQGGDSVTRVDVRSNRAVASTDVGDQPGYLAFGEGSVWVSNQAGGTVSRLDPATGAERRPRLAVAPELRDITVGEGSVWVVNKLVNEPAGMLFRISP